MSKFKICIIVSDKMVSGYVNEFINWIETNGIISLENIVLIQTKDQNKTFSRNFFGILCFRALTWLELLVLKRSSRYSSLISKGKLKSQPSIINSISVILPAGNLNIPAQALGQMLLRPPDVIINFTQFKIPDEIAHSIKHGVISFLDDGWKLLNSSVEKDAFWRVYNKEEKTEFEILQNYSGGSRTVVNGYISTKLYFALNRAAVLERQFSYLKIVIETLAKNNSYIRVNPKCEFLHSNRDPGVLEFIIYAFQLVRLIFSKVISQIFGFGNRWSVAYCNSNWQSADLSSGKKLKSRPGHYIADPFVMARDGKHYCFVEEYGYKEAKGWISVYQISEDSSKLLGVALEETFHLSFPYLFEYHGIVYMCPETSNKSEIRLYECVEFPLKWKLSKILIQNINAADTMLFEKSGRWWMFTNVDPVPQGDNCSELHVYSAESPLSRNWKPHSQNPVIIDSARSRNGGILRQGNRIFRVGQAQGYNVYGKRATVNEIVVLDEINYEEKCVTTIDPIFFKNLNGTHHFYSDGVFTVFDFVCVQNKWT